MKRIFEIALIIVAIIIVGFVGLSIFTVSIMGKSAEQNIQYQSEKSSPTYEKPVQNFLAFRLAGREFIEVDIDTLADFREILDIVEEMDCRDNYALFKLETETEIFNIMPQQLCEDIFDFKLREIIYFNTDSITVSHELRYPMDSLKIVLNNHLENVNGDGNYPSIDEKRLISINVDSTKNILETKELLLKIVTSINALNTKANFSFMFEDRGIIKVLEY